MHSSVLTHILPEIGIHCFPPLFSLYPLFLAIEGEGKNKHIVSFCSVHFLLCPRQDQLKVPFVCLAGSGASPGTVSSSLPLNQNLKGLSSAALVAPSAFTCHVGTSLIAKGIDVITQTHSSQTHGSRLMSDCRGILRLFLNSDIARR